MKTPPAELDKRLRALIEKWPELWANPFSVVDEKIKPAQTLDYESLDRIVVFLLSDQKVWSALKKRLGARTAGAPRKTSRKSSPERVIKLAITFREFEKTWKKKAAHNGLPARSGLRENFLKKHRTDLDLPANQRSANNQISKAIRALKDGRYASITINKRRYILHVFAAEAASIFACQGWWWSARLEQVLNARCDTAGDVLRLKGVRDRALRERKVMEDRGIVCPEPIPFEVIR